MTNQSRVHRRDCLTSTIKTSVANTNTSKIGDPAGNLSFREQSMVHYVAVLRGGTPRNTITSVRLSDFLITIGS